MGDGEEKYVWRLANSTFAFALNFAQLFVFIHSDFESRQVKKKTELVSALYNFYQNSFCFLGSCEELILHTESDVLSDHIYNTLHNAAVSFSSHKPLTKQSRVRWVC